MKEKGKQTKASEKQVFENIKGHNVFHVLFKGSKNKNHFSLYSSRKKGCSFQKHYVKVKKNEVGSEDRIELENDENHFLD